MGKIDKIKEDIGAFKVYQGFVVVSIITIGTGVAKLYLENSINELFWFGVVSINILILIFAIMAYEMHKKISELEDL